ncbi:hypothetical protein ACFX15_041379 [Malus domestica]
MPRSTRHKSSKHSSRDAREHSDSEKDSSLKDRKSKEESGVVRVLKDSSSSEKRKLDLKDGKDSYGGSGNGDYLEDSVSTKRRKERVDDGGSDRWNGGENDHRRSSEGSKKSLKASGESKSKKRDESVELYAEGGEVKKSSTSSGKGEGKHRDRDRDRDKESIRRDGKAGGGAERDRERDGEREREKKGKDGRTERLVSGDEQRVIAKQVNEKTDLNARDELESPDAENQIDRRMRKRRDDFGDGDKHLDDVEDINDGRLSYRDDSGRDTRKKDEKRKDERYREKHREDVDKDNKHQDDKLRDERPPKDYASSKSDDKHLKDEKDLIEMQKKRSKIQDGERKVDHDRDRNRDRDSYHVRDRNRYHDRDREREHGWDHGRDRDYDRDWDLDRDREWDGDRKRDRNHDRDRGRDHDKDGDGDYDRDYDGSHIDDRSTRYKDSSRGKKRSPDDWDDGSDKSRGMKARYSDLEKKSSSGDRVEPDFNKGRSQSRQAYVDTKLSSNKRRTSPVSNSHGGIDEYRYSNPEDLNYRDSGVEHRSKAMPPRDGSGLAGVSERSFKYRSTERPNKMDDNHLGEMSNDKSSSSKASPLPLMERSPSSSSIDRRYVNRTGVRRSLEIEETGRRSSASMDNRDFSNTEDGMGRDLPSEKPLVDESSPADSSTHNRSSQSNLSSLYPPHPNFRAGADSPFIGSMEEDGRGNSSARYRRSSDPNVVRGHGNGNAWRGIPSWTSPVPNGFMHFQHGAPHGGFQGMLPQFPAPPIFGVRPSMDINHSGMPYHMADAERFPGHLRPLGWQNMMDGPGPSHLHLWDVSNGAFRDENHMYGGAEWDQSRHPMNARGWESSGEAWKVHNNDVKRDLPSPAQKDDYPVQAAMDDAVAGKMGQAPHHEDNLDLGISKTVERRSTMTSPLKESMPKSSHDKSPGRSKLRSDDILCLSHYYLSKLDISAKLTHPEVYKQCIERSPIVDEDATTHTIVEGARAGLKSSKILLRSSPFPPLKDSVFQKAMNLYKKQRMETRVLPIIAGGALDIILASNQENMEAKVHCYGEKVEELVPASDIEMADAPDYKNAGTASGDGAEERLEVPVSSPNHELQNDTCVPSPMLEMPVDDNGGNKAGDPQTMSNGVEIESSDQAKLDDGDANGFSSPDNESLATTTLPAAANDSNVISKTKDDNPIGQASSEGAADAVTGPLIIPKSSPKACEALISGSNESDSVILSRIHHSPESTH